MLTQKAELESLEQQRGGVDRESAMLAEEVWGCLEILELKVCSDCCEQVLRLKAEVGQ